MAYARMLVGSSRSKDQRTKAQESTVLEPPTQTTAKADVVAAVPDVEPVAVRSPQGVGVFAPGAATQHPNGSIVLLMVRIFRYRWPMMVTIFPYRLPLSVCPFGPVISAPLPNIARHVMDIFRRGAFWVGADDSCFPNRLTEIGQISGWFRCSPGIRAILAASCRPLPLGFGG